ncbi:MAG: T9SS type A sorting domain-containing protein [Flammeovirgaceae bacterium]|nr:T9SS type A sorting domain-containing protein [Flammeovirgaceae bacterium]
MGPSTMEQPIWKNGATNNDSNGGNTFNGVTTIANSGSGFFRFALITLDTFNGDITLTNTGSSTIRMADDVPGTVFNGNIIVNSTFGGGIYFSESGGGTATLASGRTISVGGLGFNLGELRLRRFTQNGGTAQNLVFTGTAGIVLGPSIIFNGAVDFRAPQVFINSGSYNSTAFIEKTGATDNSGTGSSTFNAAATIRNSGTGFLRTDGNMTFNGVTSLINSGSNYLLLELNSGSNYNGDLTLINSGSSNVRMSYQGASNYNGNIEVNSTSGTGIIFSESGAATSTLANGKTISVGGTGFTAGTLTLQRFTQTGGTVQNLVLTGASTFRSGPSATWNGSLIVSSPALFLDGSVLNGATNSLIKTGASTDSSVGGNSFVGNTTFTNSGTGVFRLANVTTDDFVGNATFNQASGTIQPAYNAASTFHGTVTVDGTSPITFGANNGTITFTGSNAQNVNKSGTASPVFRRLLMNKASNAVTLTTDASVTTNAIFTAGVLNTTAANILTFVNGSTSTGGSNASHIDGPVVKIGNAAFSFPTGDAGIFRPISISAPANNTHAFRAEYFKAAQAFGGPPTYPAGILTVSSCEYWVLDRTVGTSNVNVTLSWNSPDCTGSYITNLPNLRVMRWDGVSSWVNHGNGGTTGNATAGTLITSAPITSFSPITLGSTTVDNPLPVELISFTAQVLNENVKLNWVTASELNNDFFTVQRSADGIEYESIMEINGAGTTSASSSYEYTDVTPLQNISYYRLKQTDFDKKSSYSKVIAININAIHEFVMYPNPVSMGGVVTLNKKDTYVISNNLGAIVLKVTEVTQIDISTLAQGVYIVRSSTGEIKRLVIQ